MALALILFCVFQVMTAVVHAAPTLSSSPLSVTTTIMPGSTDMADSEEKHEKRSLNRYPFATKYLGTQTRILEILENGTVRGVKKLKPEYGVVELFTACSSLQEESIKPNLHKDLGVQQYGKVSMKGVKSGLYICMNQSGYVYGAKTCTDECHFKEKPNGSHTLYYSLAYKGPKPGRPLKKRGKKKRSRKKWYLGIKKRTGEMLIGWKTKSNKKATQFLARPVDDAGYKETRYSSVVTTKSPNIDKGGSVSVEQSNSDENKFKNPERHSPKKQNRRKKTRQNRNCDDGGSSDDPFDLFRITNPPCNRKKNRQSGTKGQSPKHESLFSSSTKRRHSKGSTTKPRQTISDSANLFSFPMR